MNSPRDNLNFRSKLHNTRAFWQEWGSPNLNPFLSHSKRVDARSLRWVITFVYIVIIWLVAMGMVLSEVGITSQGYNWADTGALLWIGIVWVVVLFTKRVRDNELLRQEVMKGRFEPLQLLPLSSTKRAWLWSAPNSLGAMVLCTSMLPAVAWGVGSGLFEWREVGLLLIIVAFSLWSTPSWAPTAWRLQNAAPKPNSKDTFKLKNSTKAQSKVGDGLVMPPDLTVNSRGWSGGLGLALQILPATHSLIAGVTMGVARSYWLGLSPHVRAAAHEWWLNWPLFLVRWLGEAQPFFGFAIAPILLLLPFWIAGAAIRVLRLAAVTGSEQFWTDAHFTKWKRLQSLQSALGLLFVLGLFWPIAVEGAWLANWFGKLGGSRTQALAAWWILAVAGGALATTAMWRAALELPVGAFTLRAQWPRAAKLAVRGLGVALAFWAVSCLLGWRWPFSLLWLQILPASLAVAAVWIVSQCASHAAQRAPRFGGALASWHFVWFYGGPICGALRVLFQTSTKTFAEFFPLSPWTLWLMLREPGVGAHSIFWMACGAHTILALFTGVVAWFLGREHITATAAATANAQEDETPLDEIALQARPVNAAALPKTAQTISLTRRPLPAPDSWTARLLNWLNRFDNPILTLEMRRAIMGGLKNYAKNLLILQTLVASVPFIILPIINAVTGYWDRTTFALSVGLMLAVPCLAMIWGMSGVLLCYDRDRLDGTLELLFLTPRSSDEIARGKAGPFVVRVALLGIACLPIFLVGLLLVPTVGQSLLSAAYVGAPLWICMFALRGITGSHWMALRKQKIGATNVSFVLTLGVALCLVAEAGLVVAAFFTGATWVLAVSGMLAAIYLLETIWFWKRGVVALEGWRWNGAPITK